MSDTIKATIKELQGQLRALEDEAAQLKTTINLLCKRAGMNPIYAETERGNAGTLADINPDTFYGQPLNSCIRDYLERRRAAGIGPASVREIYDALIKGGFLFNAQSDENAQRSLRVTLSKATHTFHRLPNGSYGMLSWYPAVKAPKDNEKGEDDADGKVTESAKAAPELTDDALWEGDSQPEQKGGSSNAQKSTGPSR
jgi:hypothetical protein